MDEVLRIAASVSTPLGAVGLVAALCYLVYYRYLKSKEQVLRSVPESQRAPLVDSFLTRYHLDAKDLTREQRHDLIVKEMDKKASSTRLAIIASTVVFLASFAMAVLAYAIRPIPKVEPLQKESNSQEVWMQAVAAMRGGPGFAWGSGTTTTNRKQFVSQIDRLIKLELPQQQKLERIRDLAMTAPAYDGGDYYDMVVTREIDDLRVDVFSEIRIEAAKHKVATGD